jgi:hypothetical protein
MSGSTEVELPTDTTLAERPVEPVVAEPSERELSPRERALEAIYASRAEVVANELGLAKDLGFEAPGDEPAALAEAAAETVEPAPTEARQTPPSAPAADAPQLPQAQSDPAGHLIEIEGQQFRVDDAQLRELARMGAMANIAMARQQQAPAEHPPPVPQAVPEIDAKAIYQRIAYGSAEDGEAAVRDLAALMAQRAGPQIDPNQIAQNVRHQVKQELTLESNLQTIAREYSEIFNDTSLSQFAALKLSETRHEFAAKGIQASDLDLYREACNRVRGVIAPRQQPQSAGEPAPTALQAAPANDRLERKRAAPRNPTAVSRSAGVAAEAPRPPTQAEIIDRMRQSRGQPSLMN